MSKMEPYYLENMKPYWDRRFQEGSRIWGDSPSNTAKYACGLFLTSRVRNVLVPGSGYGRNTKTFSSAGMSIVGVEVEENTFESKPGRPVHYFTREDLKSHFRKWDTIEEGIVEDKEVYGEEGPHTHRLRYIFTRKV
jgi:hypothetical protein